MACNIDNSKVTGFFFVETVLFIPTFQFLKHQHRANSILESVVHPFQEGDFILK